MAHASARGILYGSAVSVAALQHDPAYALLIAKECGILVPETEAKWDATEPADGVFAFEALDRLMSFAANHQMPVRLHNLVWGVYNPQWVTAALRAGRGDEILTRHIAAVAGRYRGRAIAWDVVNEPSDPRWNHLDDLVNTVWRKALGSDYVVRAFEAAHAADPEARLFVNDDGLEYADALSAAKRESYLRLVPAWLARGVPIGGFGIESHLRPDRQFDEKGYRAFLRELAQMGLTVHLTELDVIDQTLPSDFATRDAAIASLCKAVLDAALDEPAVRSVTSWGLTARYSWLNADPDVARSDGLPTRGLPYDQTLTRTPMWDALARAFDGAPVRAS